MLRRFTCPLFVNVASSLNKILETYHLLVVFVVPIHKIVHDFENHCHVTPHEMRYGRDEICWNGVFAEHFVN